MDGIVRLRVIWVFLLIIFLLPIYSENKLPQNLLYLSNFRFVNEVPENYSKLIVLVSNRYFDQQKDSILEKGADPDLKMTYFVVCLKADSIYLTPFFNLERALNSISKNRDFLIFVNGYGKNFGQNLYRGFELDERYNLNVVIFDWPTDYNPVRKTIKCARKVTLNLLETLNSFDKVHKESFKGTGASLIFHSMGNHIAKDIAINYPDSINLQGNFDNIILNAPGVTQFKHARWIEKFDMQNQIYITSNKSDKTLKYLVFARLTAQLGRQAKAPHAKNAIYIDFSQIAGENHNYFIGRSEIEKEDPRVYNFYNEIFHGRPVNLNDSTVFTPKEKGMGYIIK
jgi:esterase/lipase superfamily enzyme